MTEIVVKKGSRVMRVVRLEKNKFSVIDERTNEQPLCETMSRTKLLGTISGMV